MSLNVTRQRVGLAASVPFEDLAMDPADPAVRRQVMTQLGTLTSRIRSVAQSWDQLAADPTSRRDVAEAIMDLQIEEVAYQATLQALGGALPDTLVSFLR